MTGFVCIENPPLDKALTKNGTYTLAQEFKLPYSSIVSSVQHLGGNIPYSSGRSKIFGEYDKDGNLIKSFRYDAQQFSYCLLYTSDAADD